MLSSVGRLSGAVFLAVAAVAACGGRSENLEGDEGPAGGRPGGTAGNTNGGGGASGTAAGGTLAVGGSSSGGTAVGGSSGNIGVGGSSQCGGCPLADYGLVIEGDGAPYEMHFDRRILLNDSEARSGAPVVCPVEVLHGTLGGCSRSLTLSACEAPINGPPCLEVTGRTARYAERTTGMLWDGIVLSDMANPFEPDVASGTLDLEFTNASGDILVLTVKYTFCTAGAMLDIVCAPP